MCDVSDTTNCVLGTNYYPLFIAISVIPNTWDSSFATSAAISGALAAEVKAGTWAKL
tara:strand:- start:143 stop:313 length:171 start_codon:yes stop_codon:yes gene_type:complete